MSHIASKRVNQVLGQLQPNTTQISTSSTAANTFKQDDLIYTFDNGLLTRKQREFYETNGYIVIRHIVTEKEMSVWRDHFVALCENRVERVPTMTVMRDISQVKKDSTGVKLDKKGENVITKVQDFQDDPVLFSYCAHPEIVKYVSCFTGPNIKSIHSMLIHKPPNVGESGRHPFHQDLYYFPFRPANRIVCAWTAMEKVTRANGGLSVIPGTHKGPLYKHDYPNWGGKVNKAYHGILDLEPPEDRVHLEMEPGDTVFFHPLLIHGSGANKTQGYRKAISCHYASIDCDTIDVKGTVQEAIADEVVDMAKKLGLENVTFQEVWRFKSRRVAGQGELK